LCLHRHLPVSPHLHLPVSPHPHLCVPSPSPPGACHPPCTAKHRAFSLFLTHITHPCTPAPHLSPCTLLSPHT
jgi:hypothetical protein